VKCKQAKPSCTALEAELHLSG